MSLSIFLSIVIAVLVGLSAIVQQRDKDKAAAKAAAKIDSLKEDLEDANHQLQEKTKELQKYIVGDSTIPKIYALILQDEGKIKFHFSNESKYPIPDVFVLVHDVMKVIEVKDGELNYKAPNDAMQVTVSVGTLAPFEKIRPFYKCDLVPAQKSSYMHIVHWRGGSYVGWVSVEKDGDNYKVVGYDYLLPDSTRIHEDPK